jgi:HEPN domain-containing protein
MKADTRSWIRYAEADYQQVLRNAVEPVIPEGVCNHAQQCVEKYFKAVLEEAGRPAPRTHDLGRLLEETEDLVPALRNLSSEIIHLGSLLVVSRYPTAEEEIVDLAEEAEFAEATMRSVRGIVRAYLGLEEEPQA